jgi:hypothetical protein
MTTTIAPNPKHPAKFSEPILDRLRTLVIAERRRVVGRVHPGPLTVLDPFAGVGRVHLLAGRNIVTTGVECEEEWAACHPDTIHADAFDWLVAHSGYRTTGGMAGNGDWQLWDPYDVIVTSPTYGNRFSDHHNAQDGSTRRSYTHDIGHDLHPNNSGRLPWGPKYWAFHARAYQLMYRVLPPGGLLLLNVSDFYRRDELVAATEWHRGAAMGVGFIHGGRDWRINTARLNGHGAEGTARRAKYETILQLRRSEHS